MRTNANAVWNTLVLTVHELKKKIEGIEVLLVTPGPPNFQICLLLSKC